MTKKILLSTLKAAENRIVDLTLMSYKSEDASYIALSQIREVINELESA